MSEKREGPDILVILLMTSIMAVFAWSAYVAFFFWKW